MSRLTGCKIRKESINKDFFLYQSKLSQYEGVLFYFSSINITTKKIVQKKKEDKDIILLRNEESQILFGFTNGCTNCGSNVFEDDIKVIKIIPQFGGSGAEITLCKKYRKELKKIAVKIKEGEEERWD